MLEIDREIQRARKRERTELRGGADQPTDDRWGTQWHSRQRAADAEGGAQRARAQDTGSGPTRIHVAWGEQGNSDGIEGGSPDDDEISVREDPGWREARVENRDIPLFEDAHADPRDNPEVYRLMRLAAAGAEDSEEGVSGPGEGPHGGWVVDMMAQHLRGARHRGGRHAGDSAWGTYMEFTEWAKTPGDDSPFRPKGGDEGTCIREGARLGRYVLWMAYCKGYKTSTVGSYLALVQGRHEDEVGHRIPEGSGVAPARIWLKRMAIHTPGVVRDRDAIKREDLAEWLRQKDRRGIGLLEAALSSFAFSALARAAELARGRGGEETSGAPKMRHVTVVRDSHGRCDEVVVKLKPVKKSEASRRSSGADGEGRLSIHLGYEGGEGINAAREMWALYERRLAEGAGPDDAFFVHEGREARTWDVERVAKEVAAFGGNPGESVGGHSFRAGGATEEARKGMTMPQLKLMGRWDSDIALIYARYSGEDGRELVRRITE